MIARARLALTATLLVVLATGQAKAEAPNDLKRGKAIAADRNAGNCLSCHMMGDGELPGNSGPPLMQMALRFPDRAVLRAQIWDATVRNPESVMPPYGRNLILTEQEIDLVVDYVLSL
ncbi:MAG: sulfur oxidation c-type cytochrome SoxX [Pseudomonadales bacterium]|nr:sulfur oxidation c-type cytochrome SoxX [Pseudomonadales bacterium]NIX08094.1 sulfur oxidation c-type cytochrome SoxX [Pseudomonadales bacterium]